MLDHLLKHHSDLAPAAFTGALDDYRVPPDEHERLMKKVGKEAEQGRKRAQKAREEARKKQRMERSRLGSTAVAAHGATAAQPPRNEGSAMETLMVDPSVS